MIAPLILSPPIILSGQAESLHTHRVLWAVPRLGVKATTLKAKAKAKDLASKAKAKAKDLAFEAKAKAKYLAFEAKAKAKDLAFKAKAKAKDLASRPRPRPRPRTMSRPMSIWFAVQSKLQNTDVYCRAGND